MNQLRQLMLEELRHRNFVDTTIRTYLHGVEHFSRYFRRRPDQLGPEDIRKYQAALFTQFKCSPNTVILRLGIETTSHLCRFTSVSRLSFNCSESWCLASLVMADNRLGFLRVCARTAPQ